MGEITKLYDSVIDLTIYKVEGEVTFDEVWDQTRVFFNSNPSKFVLWDFTSGTVASISNQEAEKIAKRGSEISAKIERGKAALLAPKDIDFGMSRVFQVYSEIEEFPFEIEVFRDLNTAQKWLISGQ